MVNGIEMEPCLRHSVFRASCWALCSAIAIYTTKQLMTTFNYPHPATIVSRLFGTLLFGYILALFVDTKARDSEASVFSSLKLRPPEWMYLSQIRIWLYVTPAAIMAAASLPLLFNGIFHMESLAALIMLSPLVFVAECTIFSICESSSSSRYPQGRIRMWLMAFLVVLTSAVIMGHERRLSKSGLLWGVASSLSVGITRALMDIGLKRAEGTDGSSAVLHYKHSFIILSLTIGFVVSSLGAALYEQDTSWYEISTSTNLLTLLNIFSFVGAILAGSSPLLFYPSSSLGDSAGTQPGSASSTSDGFVSSTPVLMVLLAVAYLNPEVVITWTQILFYLLGVLCVIDITGGSISGASQQGYKYIRKSPSLWDGNCLIRSIVILFPCYLALALILVKSSVMPRFPQLTHSTVLDTSYISKSPFDIVVSMYREDPHEVRTLLQAIKATKMLQNMTPRVILYTKDNQANTTALKLTTGADVVTSLENRGREGATYLGHIITRWDELATQTLFIQAQPHDLNEILAQLNSYLIPDTGMLSLGITGIQCTCEACEDTSTWEDTWRVVPDLYRKVYNRQCDDRTQILMTYAGQFVASARRMRGISKNIYQDLFEALTSESGWAHDPDKLGHEHLVDSVERPNFGFTIERTWALLMQCATNAKIAARCPSLLSGRWIEGEVADCQCLDKE